MNDELLTEALKMVYDEQFSQFDNPPKHKLPLRHKIAVKRILRGYEKKCAEFCPQSLPKPKLHLTRKTVVLIAIVMFLAVICGFTMPYYVSRSFKGRIHPDYTRIISLDKNGPETIEYIYEFPAMPEGFEHAQRIATPFYEDNLYRNVSTNQEIYISQSPKPSYGGVELDTEHGKLEEVEINGHYGIMLEIIEDDSYFIAIIWDNGDYILDITCDVDKTTALNLAKSAKIKEK